MAVSLAVAVAAVGAVDAVDVGAVDVVDAVDVGPWVGVPCWSFILDGRRKGIGSQ
jgi:hypothetical protein